MCMCLRVCGCWCGYVGICVRVCGEGRTTPNLHACVRFRASSQSPAEQILILTHAYKVNVTGCDLVRMCRMHEIRYASE